MKSGGSLAAAGRFEREIRNFVVGGLLFLLFLSGLSLVVLRNLAAWGESEYLERVTGSTRAAAGRLAVTDEPTLALTSDAPTADLLKDVSARSAALYDEEGNLLSTASYLPDASAPRRLELRVAPGETATAPLAREDPPLLVVATSFRGGTRILRVGFDASVLALARRNVRLISVVVPVSALVLGILVVPFLRRLLRPFDALTETARGAGPLVTPREGASLAPTERREEPDEAEQAIRTFVRTIEELKRSSQELEELRRRETERADALAITAETLVRSHPGGLLVVDADERLSQANGPAMELLELPVGALGGLAKDVLPWEPILEALDRARSRIPTLGQEFATGDSTGGRRFALTAVPVVNALGIPLGTILFIEDRTTTNRLQHELSRRRELSALGEMSAGIAHEFRNATATILGYARLAAATEDRSARERHLLAIRTEAEHVARVTGDFLFFARPELIAMVPTRLRALVEEIVGEEGVSAPRVSFELYGTFGLTPIDPPLLRRALVNLIRNAQEAACAGGRAGRVTIRGEEGPEGEVWLAVEDDGPGIEPSAESKLFVPFFSTKESGTGLGLALVAKIAALHGGSIAAERSTALGGARFVFRFPPAAPDAPEGAR
ncbi:MAG: ATP-binding protein [Thermoanaerobaculia bacterium]